MKTEKFPNAAHPATVPSDYEPCGDCGFDHGYEQDEAVKAHKKNTRCSSCATVVEDGISGDVSTVPWCEDSRNEEGSGSSGKFAICYECENKQMAQAETDRVMQSIKAAERSGRMDCI